MGTQQVHITQPRGQPPTEDKGLNYEYDSVEPLVLAMHADPEGGAGHLLQPLALTRDKLVKSL